MKDSLEWGARAPVSNLSAEHYTVLHEFLEQQAGIRLGIGKEYLVTSRLSRVIRNHQLNSFEELVEQLGSRTSKQLQLAVVDAMTTNETFWFRDAPHYSLLTGLILPQFREPRLRLWSAACSTGQEPYSLAMALRGGRGIAGGQFEIVGTDISKTALAQAREGRYCGLSASRGLTDEQRRRYFRSDGECLIVLPQYRHDVSFRDFNLLSPYEGLGRFQVIFCRNVLIYFSTERKRDILERMARSLVPGGYLVLGSTESINGHNDLFEMVSGYGGLAYRRR